MPGSSNSVLKIKGYYIYVSQPVRECNHRLCTHADTQMLLIFSNITQQYVRGASLLKIQVLLIV